MREGCECSDTHSLRLICPTRFLRESTRAEITCIRHGPLEGQPCKMCNNDTCDEVKHVVLLRGQDADCEKCPLKPEDEYRKVPRDWGRCPPPNHPVGHDPGQNVGMHYVQTRPCVPRVVRGVNEGEESVLPCTHRAPINLVSHVDLGR